MIRILLADDHELVRVGLKRLLEDEPDFVVVGEAASFDELLSAARGDEADVAVLDISMPGPGIVRMLQELRAASANCHAVVLSMHPEETWAVRAIRAGASAYLTKDTTATHLAAAIRRAHEGSIYLTVAVGGLLAAEVASPARPDPLSLLSDRERTVLRLLGAGHSSKRIAALLQISPKTVSTYRSRLLEKLGLRSTAELIRYAITQHLAD